MGVNKRGGVFLRGDETPLHTMKWVRVFFKLLKPPFLDPPDQFKPFSKIDLYRSNFVQKKQNKKTTKSFRDIVLWTDGRTESNSWTFTQNQVSKKRKKRKKHDKSIKSTIQSLEWVSKENTFLNTWHIPLWDLLSILRNGQPEVFYKNYGVLRKL